MAIDRKALADLTAKMRQVNLLDPKARHAKNWKSKPGILILPRKVEQEQSSHDS